MKYYESCTSVTHTNWFVVFLLFLTAQAVPASEVMLGFDGILSADIVEQVSGREIREHRSHIWMGKQGLAVVTKGIAGKTPRIIYVYNHKEDKSWIVSPEGKRYCELSKESDDADFAGGILSTKPCLGFDTHKLKEVEWDDQVVTVWQCHKQQRDIGKHFFSVAYGVVVKEEGADGIIRELNNISLFNELQMDEATEGISSEFKPVNGYRAVTVNEFFFAKRPLDRYLE